MSGYFCTIGMVGVGVDVGSSPSVGDGVLVGVGAGSRTGLSIGVGVRELAYDK